MNKEDIGSVAKDALDVFVAELDHLSEQDALAPGTPAPGLVRWDRIRRLRCGRI